MNMRLNRLPLIVVLAVVPSHAVADSKSAAERHFKRAKSFHARGEYANALKELTAAHAVEPTPVLLYGIAQTHVKLGQCPEAITFYQRFIDTKPNQEGVVRALAAIEACKTPAMSPPPAPAGEPTAAPSPATPPTLTAKEHFARATSFHKQADYASALRELTSAYDAEPTPSLIYAIAQTHVKLGQCPDAITFYRRFIDSKPKHDAIERAQTAIANCVASAPTAEKNPVAPTTADPAKTAQLRIAPVDVVRKEMPPAGEPATTPTERPKDDPHVDLVRIDREDRFDQHPTRTWAYAGAALGASAMLVGTIFGASADATQKSFDDAGCGDRNQTLSADAVAQCLDYERRGDRNVRIGNALLVGGGGTLALFAILYIIDPGNLERPRLEHPKFGRPTVSLSTSSVQLTVPW